MVGMDAISVSVIAMTVVYVAWILWLEGVPDDSENSN